jgi:hypothetical protein
MTFQLLCMTLIALLFGLAVCFNGYRWFLFLLPFFAFLFGFFWGAQTLQAIFGSGFLTTVLSWIGGFIIGLIFALLSYMFYLVGVAIVAASFGYSLGVGLMNLIGIDLNLLVWLVGIAVAIIVAAVTLLLNIQKYVIIVITAFLGAGVIVGSLLSAVGGIEVTNLAENPVRVALQNSPLWMLFFLILGVLGIAAQLVSTRGFVLETPENRV